MADVNYYSFIKDFVSPASLLLFALTYILNRHNDNKRHQEETDTKKISLIDTLSIGLNRIDNLFESLKVDAEKNNFFTYRNILNARPIVERIQKVSNDIIIFSDDEFRKEVLEIIDLLTSLIDDVNDLENYATSESNKYKESEQKYLDGLQNLRMRFLQQGIEIDDSLNPKYLKSKGFKNDTTLQTAKKIVGITQAQFQVAQNEIENANKFCKDKRVFYAMRILDAQAKLRDLNDTQENLRESLINKKG